MVTKLVAYGNTRFIGKAIMTDADFVAELDKLNGFAASRGLKIFITDSARRDGAFTRGIVPVAKFSNHFVGHAIDMNIQTSNAFLIAIV